MEEQGRIEKDEYEWKVPSKFNILASAKSRGKTYDEYIAGGITRWNNLHLELAYDRIEGMMQAVAYAKPRKDSK